MCRELFRIPVEWGGTPLLGLGWLLAFWLVGFGVWLAIHAKRRGIDSDFWGYLQPAVIGALVLAFVPRIAPMGIPIRGYGVMLLLAISVGVAMAVHRANRHGIDTDTILGLVFWLFVFGIGGARTFFVIEYWQDLYAGKPLGQTLVQILQFTEGGLVVYGSVIGGVIAFVWYSWRHKLPVMGMADILAPAFMAGLAIGRVGCLLNGCCFGGPCDLPWAVTFPADSPPFMDQLMAGELHGVRIVEDSGNFYLAGDEPLREVTAINGQPIESPLQLSTALGEAYAYKAPIAIELADGSKVTRPVATQKRSLPIHPTQIYSTINAALTAWLLWVWFPQRRRDGEVALLMFTLYPISRFLLETIRTDESAIFGTGLSISQNVSLIVFTLAVIGWIVTTRMPRGRQLVEVPGRPAAGVRTGAVSTA